MLSHVISFLNISKVIVLNDLVVHAHTETGIASNVHTHDCKSG